MKRINSIIASLLTFIFVLSPVLAQEADNSTASLMNVDERNAAWVAKMPDMLKAHPTLFIVGLAHLLPYHGAEGIVERLRKLGYEVTPMN